MRPQTRRLGKHSPGRWLGPCREPRGLWLGPQHGPGLTGASLLKAPNRGPGPPRQGLATGWGGAGGSRAEPEAGRNFCACRGSKISSHIRRCLFEALSAIAATSRPNLDPQQ